MPKFCDHCGAAIWGQFCGACGAEGPAAAAPPPPPTFGAATAPPGVTPRPDPVGVTPPPDPVGRSRKRSPLLLTVGIIGAGLAAIVLVLALSGGGSSSPDSPASPSGHRYQYPAKVEDTFVRACTSNGGTDGQCRCALGHLEDSISFARFIEMDSEARTTGKVPQDALTALQGC